MTADRRFTIGKVFRFDATRIIDGAYDGHAFIAEAVLSAGELTPVGFVADFRDLEALKKYIGTALDHRELSSVLDDAGDAAIAGHLYRWSATHLPDRARACLTEIRVRTGRATAPNSSAAVGFEATHRLDGLRDGHPCGRVHGHSYSVSVDAGSEGAALLGDLGDYIKSTLDGAFLNQVLPFNPTSELLAEHLGRRFRDRQLTGSPGRIAVRVSETESSWAEYLVRTP